VHSGSVEFARVSCDICRFVSGTPSPPESTQRLYQVQVRHISDNRPLAQIGTTLPPTPWLRLVRKVGCSIHTNAG
jgi:hypothetical protein